MSDQVSDVASTSAPDDGEESDSSKPKNVHSMVEKKRRDKMAQHVTELSNLIPMCGVMQRKLDKITVLRMAVQHLKAIKGSKVSPSTDAPPNTPLANEGMMKAVLESADCFLFVIACDRGKFLYVSESASNFIHSGHTELIGQSIFDVLHSKDIAVVKEQLIASDVTCREVFIDAKTMEPVNPGVVPKEELNIASPGAARSFFCRMKSRLQSELVLKTEPDVVQDHTKKKRPGLFNWTWASSKVTSEAGLTDPSEISCNLSCLVAIARISARLSQTYLDSHGHVNMKPMQFYARLNCDHQFSFVEPMVTYVTGFLPQDIIHSPVFDLFMDEDLPQIKELLKMSTKTNEKLVSSVINIKTVDHLPICVRVIISSFNNPLTSELEHILLDVTAVASYTKSNATLLSADTYQEDVASKHTKPQSIVTASVHSDPTMSGGEEDDDVNNEASKAIMMSLLEADGGLGGDVLTKNLSWLLPKSSQANQ